MGFEKIKYFLGFDVVDDEDDDQEEEFAKNEFSFSENKSNLEKDKIEFNSVYDKINNKSSYAQAETKKNNQINVTLFKPKNFNDAAIIVDNLKNDKPVVINLQHLDTETARKIFDFSSGAIYALNGKLSKVSNDVFLLAPSNVDIFTNIPSTEEDEEN